MNINLTTKAAKRSEHAIIGSAKPTVPSHQSFPIAVAGLSEAGKTAFIRRLRGSPLETLLRTVGIDVEMHRSKDSLFRLFDLGGSKAFRKVLWEHYIRSAEGIVFVVDGADPTSFPEARECFSRVMHWAKPDTPVLLLWNKSDRPEYVSYSRLPDEFRFNIPGEEGSFPFFIAQVSVLQDEGIQAAFDWLAERIRGKLLQQPIELHALRVYSRTPEMIIAEMGRINVFEVFLELCVSFASHVTCNYVPLKGGNYLVSSVSELYFCAAIFYGKTPPILGQKFAATALQALDAYVQESGRVFPFEMPDTEMPLGDYLSNSRINPEIIK
ncbi:MAG: ADP-ribosylation factor-like protein [Candidatus Hodarchaeales archaeon]|jgi:small GTP-binding protein